MLAVRSRSPKVMQLLLKNNANVNAENEVPSGLGGRVLKVLVSFAWFAGSISYECLLFASVSNPDQFASTVTNAKYAFDPCI